MQPDAAIVTAATWVAALALGCLAVRAATSLAARHHLIRPAICGAVVAAVAASGVAMAGTGHAGDATRPAVPLDWPQRARAPVPAVTVRAGDSLWLIAGRRIHRPTAAHIARAWPRWWQTNHHVIGRDPDLIRPGQRLRPPTVRSPS